jgi:hypothetical protein
MNEKAFYSSILGSTVEELSLRHLYALIGLFVLLTVASAAAGSFTAKMDVDAYVDADNASESFSEGDNLWAASVGGEPVKEVYLSFINNFGTVGVFSPDNIESADLKLYVTEVEEPGEITAYLVHGATFDTVTWDDKPEYGTNASASIDVEDVGEYTVDVTELIEEAVKTCVEGCPYSIVLVAEDNASVAFASMESSEGAAELEYSTVD